MKYLVAAALVAATAAGFASTANAAQGCGPGAYRNAYGVCVAKRVVVVRPAPVYVRPAPVYRPAPVVVVRPGRGCPAGMYWRGGRCRY